MQDPWCHPGSVPPNPLANLYPRGASPGAILDLSQDQVSQAVQALSGIAGLYSPRPAAALGDDGVVSSTETAFRCY